MNAKLLRAATILSALSILGYLSLAPGPARGQAACGGHGEPDINGTCVCDDNFALVGGTCAPIGGSGGGSGGNAGGGSGGGGSSATCGGHGEPDINGNCVCEANFQFVDGICKQIGGSGSGDGTAGGGGGGSGGGGENTGGGNVPGTTTPAGSGPGGPNTPVGTQDPPAKAEEDAGDKGGGGCCG